MKYVFHVIWCGPYSLYFEWSLQLSWEDLKVNLFSRLGTTGNGQLEQEIYSGSLKRFSLRSALLDVIQTHTKLRLSSLVPRNRTKINSVLFLTLGLISASLVDCWCVCVCVCVLLKAFNWRERQLSKCRQGKVISSQQCSHHNECDFNNDQEKQI